MKQIGMIASLVSVLAVSAPVAASADNIERIGDVLQLASPAYALYLSNSLNGRAGLYSCGKAIGTTFLATHALKYAIDAPRPNGGAKVSHQVTPLLQPLDLVASLAKRGCQQRH